MRGIITQAPTSVIREHTKSGGIARHEVIVDTASSYLRRYLLYFDKISIVKASTHILPAMLMDTDLAYLVDAGVAEIVKCDLGARTKRYIFSLDVGGVNIASILAKNIIFEEKARSGDGYWCIEQDDSFKFYNFPDLLCPSQENLEDAENIILAIKSNIVSTQVALDKLSKYRDKDLFLGQFEDWEPSWDEEESDETLCEECFTEADNPISAIRSIFPECQMSQIPGLRFELYNLLPLPTHDIPLPEILEFKYRRKANLEELQAAIDRLYLEFVNSGDFAVAKLASTEKLLKNIKALETLMKESRIRTIYGNLKVDINLQALGVTGAGALAVCAGHDVGWYGVLGGLATSIKFEKTISSKQISQDGLRDYAYAIYVKEDLI